jgi:hypothetical protein
MHIWFHFTFKLICPSYFQIILQHVLEHGKPHERSAIIKKLTGQIVQMSQQKFASNVIEKCLTFGTPAERQALVDEMLGTTDENEPLQVCDLCVYCTPFITKHAKKHLKFLLMYLLITILRSLTLPCVFLLIPICLISKMIRFRSLYCKF